MRRHVPDGIIGLVIELIDLAHNIIRMTRKLLDLAAFRTTVLRMIYIVWFPRFTKTVMQIEVYGLTSGHRIHYELPQGRPLIWCGFSSNLNNTEVRIHAKHALRYDLLQPTWITRE